MSQRLNRVNEIIKREIGQSLNKEINFNGILVTVIDVETSSDLRQAKIKITVLPEEKSGLVLSIIQKNIYFLQQTVNKKLKIRRAPKIRFEMDKGASNAQRVEELLREMEE